MSAQAPENKSTTNNIQDISGLNTDFHKKQEELKQKHLAAMEELYKKEGFDIKAFGDLRVMLAMQAFSTYPTTQLPAIVAYAIQKANIPDDYRTLIAQTTTFINLTHIDIYSFNLTMLKQVADIFIADPDELVAVKVALDSLADDFMFNNLGDMIRAATIENGNLRQTPTYLPGGVPGFMPGQHLYGQQLHVNQLHGQPFYMQNNFPNN